MASVKMMNPVHAIGVFHDQNGSIFASVAASDTTMIARPIQTACPLNTMDIVFSCDTHSERAAAERRRADAFAENQHFVGASEAPWHHQRLHIANCGLRIAGGLRIED